VGTLILLALALTLRSWAVLVVLCVVAAANAGQWLFFRYYLKRAGLEEVDEMTGWEFERWLEHLFTDLGFAVKRTAYRGDFGADLICTWKSGTRLAVQAKRASRLVGVQAVQEVLGAKAYYSCDQAMVVTNSYFTDQAIALARAAGVQMRSRDDLAREVVKVRRTVHATFQTVDSTSTSASGTRAVT
jgi:restriction system protein